MPLKTLAILLIPISISLSMVMDLIMNLLRIPAESRLITAGLCTNITCFLIPYLCVFTPSIGSRTYHYTIQERIVISVLSTWFLLCFLHVTIAAPASLEITGKRIDALYHSIGGYVAIILGGWISPLLITLTMLFMKKGLNHFRSQTA